MTLPPPLLDCGSIGTYCSSEPLGCTSWSFLDRTDGNGRASSSFNSVLLLLYCIHVRIYITTYFRTAGNAVREGPFAGNEATIIVFVYSYRSTYVQYITYARDGCKQVGLLSRDPIEIETCNTVGTKLVSDKFSANIFNPSNCYYYIPVHAST
jgi:hypothetical protein